MLRLEYLCLQADNFDFALKYFGFSSSSSNQDMMARSPLAARYHSTVSSELIVFKDEVRGEARSQLLRWSSEVEKDGNEEEHGESEPLRRPRPVPNLLWPPHCLLLPLISPLSS